MAATKDTKKTITRSVNRLRRKVSDDGLRQFIRSHEDGTKEVLIEVGTIARLNKSALTRRGIIRGGQRSIKLKPRSLKSLRATASGKSRSDAEKKIALNDEALETVKNYIQEISTDSSVNRLDIGSMLVAELSSEQLEMLANRPEVSRILPNRTHHAGLSR